MALLLFPFNRGHLYAETKQRAIAARCNIHGFTYGMFAFVWTMLAGNVLAIHTLADVPVPILTIERIWLTPHWVDAVLISFCSSSDIRPTISEDVISDKRRRTSRHLEQTQSREPRRMRRTHRSRL